MSRALLAAIRHPCCAGIMQQHTRIPEEDEGGLACSYGPLLPCLHQEVPDFASTDSGFSGLFPEEHGEGLTCGCGPLLPRLHQEVPYFAV